jgi:hypothetical protein
MDKTEVYSWRVDPELKSALENAARVEGTSLSRLLDRIAGEWLRREVDSSEREREQDRIREHATRYIGSIHGKDPRRARETSQRVKTILAGKHARRGTG